MRKFAENGQTIKQTSREFKTWGHSNHLWIVGESGPIVSKYIWENSTRNLRTYDDCEDEEQLLTNDSPNIDVQKDY